MATEFRSRYLYTTASRGTNFYTADVDLGDIKTHLSLRQAVISQVPGHGRPDYVGLPPTKNLLYLPRRQRVDALGTLSSDLTQSSWTNA
ncbi:hypothetical protein EVAR_10120_1 [Eumeta japonica]|uniref:Uncharacterized protein n=1 Tax=Eumeta variegata TaxID=151549 RepID=A0A4C1UCD2_EUMVA|nr:hypothetical protein EVAR_10120_1 [Eumeta japonica]